MTASAIALGSAAKDINSVSRGLQSLAPLVQNHAGAWAVMLIVRLLFLYFIVQNINKRKAIKKKLGSCDTLCAEATCLPDICEASGEVVAHYQQLIGMLPKTSLGKFRFVRFMLNSEINEWQELAEDCALAADSEFRGLVHTVASHL